MARTSRLVFSAAVAALFVLSACAPRATPDQASGSGGAQDLFRSRKVLTIANKAEPDQFQGGKTAGGSIGANAENYIVHNYLVVQVSLADQYDPQLASEQLSVERGTWRVNPDGSMDVTWKLRPNIKWHDGTPFTSDDLLFSFNVYKDPEVPNTWTSSLRLMESASASDPQTFVVHWSATYANADQAPGLVAMPRHLLEEVYRTDKAGFVDSSRFTTDFVGLGPYKLMRWERGSHMEFARFDDYFMDRPAFDTVVVRYLSDPTTAVANILAEAVQVVPPFVVDLETALELRERWQGTGHQVLTELSDKVRLLDVQLRPEIARPREGLIVLPVRQAFYQAIDRQTMAEIMTQGLGAPADSWYSPAGPLRRDVESSVPQYQYDPARAQQSLAEAGWVRGADGILVNSRTGERFEVQISAKQNAREQKEQNIVRDGWAAIGAQVSLYVIPAALQSDREHFVTRPGVTVFSSPGTFFWAGGVTHSKSIAGPENRWVGLNRTGYVNPNVDVLLDRLAVTVDIRERLPLHRELARLQVTDLPSLPLYWGIETALALKGVKGVRGIGLYNFHEWDLD